MKPDNIWLEPNDKGGVNVKALDFGIAHLEEPDIQAKEDEKRAVTILISGYSEETLNQPFAAERTITLNRGDLTTTAVDVITEPESREEQLTRAGALMGTPAYMSPEQAFGKPVTKQSDIYRLGVIAYDKERQENETLFI